MPYKNIVWIKLHLELFDEDDRFLYQLTEKQQLLYIKMLYLAGRQQNKISKNPLLIIQKVNYQGATQELLKDIEQIKSVFPKFKETKHFYTFTKFEEIHNQVRVGLAQVKPKFSPRAVPDKDKEEDKEGDKDKEGEFVFLKENLFLKTWGEYLEMRQKIRKPATDRAKEMVLLELHKYDLETAVKMLEQSILNSWQGVFPLKEKIGNLTKAQKSNLSGLKKTMERISNDKSKLSTGLPCIDSGVSRSAI